MNTKIIICLLTAALLSTVPFVEAQQSRIYRVGVLAPPGKVEESSNIKGLRAGLAEAGYVRGQESSVEHSQRQNLRRTPPDR